MLYFIVDNIVELYFMVNNKILEFGFDFDSNNGEVWVSVVIFIGDLNFIVVRR